MAFSANLPPVLVAATDLSLGVILSVMVAREVAASKNWRNMIVVGLIGVFTVSNALFHWEAAQGEHAAQGGGVRLGLASAMMLIAVVGGRIVPAFTRNWMVKRGEDRLPVPPMQRLDVISLAVLAAALLLWAPYPDRISTGALMVAAGVAHAIRLGRWRGMAHRVGGAGMGSARRLRLCALGRVGLRGCDPRRRMDRSRGCAAPLDGRGHRVDDVGGNDARKSAALGPRLDRWSRRPSDLCQSHSPRFFCGLRSGSRRVSPVRCRYCRALPGSPLLVVSRCFTPR